jgi:hypothetical protein
MQIEKGLKICKKKKSKNLRKTLNKQGPLLQALQKNWVLIFPLVAHLLVQNVYGDAQTHFGVSHYQLWSNYAHFRRVIKIHM